MNVRTVLFALATLAALSTPLPAQQTDSVKVSRAYVVAADSALRLVPVLLARIEAERALAELRAELTHTRLQLSAQQMAPVQVQESAVDKAAKYSAILAAITLVVDAIKK